MNHRIKRKNFFSIFKYFAVRMRTEVPKVGILDSLWHVLRRPFQNRHRLTWPYITSANPCACAERSAILQFVRIRAGVVQW
jgi:hypothetical protein